MGGVLADTMTADFDRDPGVVGGGELDHEGLSRLVVRLAEANEPRLSPVAIGRVDVPGTVRAGEGPRVPGEQPANGGADVVDLAVGADQADRLRQLVHGPLQPSAKRLARGMLIQGKDVRHVSEFLVSDPHLTHGCPPCFTAIHHAGPEEPRSVPSDRPPEAKGLSWTAGFQPDPTTLRRSGPSCCGRRKGTTCRSSPASSPRPRLRRGRGTPARQRPASAGTGGSPGWPCSPARPADPTSARPRRPPATTSRPRFSARSMVERTITASSLSLDMPITKGLVDLHLVDREALSGTTARSTRCRSRRWPAGPPSSAAGPAARGFARGQP